MMLNQSISKNRKAQVFIIGVIIIVTFGLISAFILLNYMFDDKSQDEHLGVYQSGMMDTLIQGDQSYLYLDQAAKYASNSALKNFTENGGVSMLPDSGEKNPQAPCGKYIYNLWNTQSDDCYPDYRTTFSVYMQDVLNDELSQSSIAPLKNEADYEFTYLSKDFYTQLRGITSDEDTFYVFKTTQYSEKKELQQYIANKETYSGSFIWPLKDNTKIVSCFGYRGVVSNGAGQGSTNHPGIDISAPKGTDVVAVADGTVSGFQKSWGAIILDHGSGVKTVYGHLSKYDVEVGEHVTQGQKIGEVGDTASPGHFHLHFEVIMNNLDSSLNLQGVPALVKTNRGQNTNPLCSFDKQYLEQNNIKLSFETNFGCTHVCGPTASTCAQDSSDAKYKFCNLYGIKKSIDECQITENSDWKITNLMASSKSITSDQKFNITLTIENPSKDCVTIIPRPEIQNTNTQEKYEPATNIKANVYPQSEKQRYVNIAIECVFVEDSLKLKELNDAGKCALLISDNKVSYKITAAALDAKGKPVRADALVANVEVSRAVQKQSEDNSQHANSMDISLIDPKVKNNYEAVKRNMEKYHIIENVNSLSQEYPVPKEIMLGLLTQESSGVPGKKSSDGKGGGLGQTSWNEFDSTWNAPAIKKGCKIEQLTQTDDFAVHCQLESAYLHLLDKKKISDDDAAYEKGVKSTCKNPTYQKIYLSYPPKSWERALRTYNGFGCAENEYKVYQYVDKVMTYSKLWGYAGTEQITQYQEVAKDEIQKGIIGKYSINPSFVVDMNFDMSLLDKLNKAMMNTSDMCKGKDGSCIRSQVDLFNKEISSQYLAKDVYVELSMDCETSDEEKIADQYVQNIEECWDSPDSDCQCEFEKSALPLTVSGSADSTIFEYADADGKSHSIESYHVIYDENGNLLSRKSITTGSQPVYKGFDYLKFKNVTTKKCEPIKNKYKLCLKTNYTVPKSEKGALIYENLTLKFAITLKDNVPPKPVTGLELYNKEHSNKSVLVEWDKHPDVDVQKYIIYLADDASGFDQNISEIRNSLHYRELDVLEQGYMRYESLDIANAHCELTSGPAGKYCIFKYHATAMDGKQTEIILEDNKLYYINSTNKFLYILDGSDTYNGLTDDSEKYVAVTAVDLSGNEINNIDDGQKIAKDENLKDIKARYSLEIGFSEISQISIRTVDGIVMSYYSMSKLGDMQGNVVLNWERPKTYIDGTALGEDVKLKYKLYNVWTNCDSVTMSVDSYCELQAPYNAIKEEDNLLMSSVSVDMLSLNENVFGVVASVPDVPASEYAHAFTKKITK